MRPKILIVDDVKMNVVMLQALASKLGDCDTTCFTSSPDALAWCRENEPDLVLLDYLMPELDGGEFLTALRTIEHCHDVPTLIITGRQEREFLLKALEAGANDFLCKPVDPVEFHARARNALRLGVALKRLRHLAMTDELTGLMNRRAFMTLLAEEQQRAMRYGQSLSVAIIDIDHFKSINDRFGHAAGDATLVRVVDLCRGALRNSDVMARLGGEEFGVLMPGTAGQGAHYAVERLRLAVDQSPFAHGTMRFPVTISAGVASYSDGQDGIALLSAADMMLYRAKADGRNRTIGFDDALCA
ncbi:MAG TPA: diguanylate cyclase [Sphingomonas sp.]